ncbi:uncharacterized protein HaLaN_01045 [Haematococcus lacustris]|uniref:RRM domain-containing protein n=1 Tax=Haematococcus lacustris TaxID=44745 RepID=A0A699YF15_HAELA|nr:uncharacterized protein HaLaN_01045 [Haematococcus lacustris]
MQDYNTGRSRGFGWALDSFAAVSFVTFEEEGALERVFEAGVMHVLSGKQVEVKPATPKGQQPLPSSMGMQGQQQLGGPTPYYSMVGPGTASGMRYPPPHGPRGQAMGYSMTPLPHYSGLGRSGAGPVAMGCLAGHPCPYPTSVQGQSAGLLPGQGYSFATMASALPTHVLHPAPPSAARHGTPPSLPLTVSASPAQTPLPPAGCSAQSACPSPSQPVRPCPAVQAPNPATAPSACATAAPVQCSV